MKAGNDTAKQSDHEVLANEKSLWFKLNLFVIIFGSAIDSKTLIFSLSWFEIFGRHVAPGHSSERVKAPVGLQAETDIFSVYLLETVN